jgi:hypothetical protein
VKLVEGGQLLGRQPLILTPEGRERALQPLGQPYRAIVVAYAVKDIGHRKAPGRIARDVLDAITRLPLHGSKS